MDKSTIAKLNRMHACIEAMAWLKEQDSFEQAWADCTRGDWMLWLVGRCSGASESDERKKVVATACECARLSLPFAKSPAVLSCIETAERWVRGRATKKEVREARKTVYAYAAGYAIEAAGYAAYAVEAAAYVAAYAAGYAAYAVETAVYAVETAAYAAGYAVETAAYAAGYAVEATAARTKTLAQCADIVRAHYPTAPVLP